MNGGLESRVILSRTECSVRQTDIFTVIPIGVRTDNYIVWVDRQSFQGFGPAVIGSTVCFTQKNDMNKYYVRINRWGEFWGKDSQLQVSHRVFGPAATWKNGNTFWHQENKLHRENGPAIIFSDGSGTYWIRGTQIRQMI